MEHIRKEDNVRADTLSRLATTKKKSHRRSIVQIFLRNPQDQILLDDHPERLCKICEEMY